MDTDLSNVSFVDTALHGSTPGWSDISTHIPMDPDGVLVSTTAFQGVEPGSSNIGTVIPMELDPPNSLTSMAADAYWRGENSADSTIMVSLSKFKASDAVGCLSDLEDDYPDIRSSAMLYEVPITGKKIPNALV
jgi:hypothetical protein